MNLINGPLHTSFEYRSPTVGLSIFEDDNNTFTTVVGRFIHKTNIVDTVSYVDRSLAVGNFLSNVHGSLVMSSFSSMTPLFVTGHLNVPTMEIPAFNFSSYELAVFVYYKIRALYGDSAEVTEFKFQMDVPVEVCVDLDTFALDDENPYVNEITWVAAMNQIDEPEEATIDDIVNCEISLPWWRRPSGEMRDFFNFVDIDNPDHMDNLTAFSIDLGIDLQESIEQEEKRKHDKEVAKKIAEDYRSGAELPDEVLKEISGLVDTLGLDINTVLDSITDGTLIDNSYEDSEFVERMVGIYEEHTKEPQGDDDGNDKGPTVVSL